MRVRVSLECLENWEHVLIGIYVISSGLHSLWISWSLIKRVIYTLRLWHSDCGFIHSYSELIWQPSPLLKGSSSLGNENYISSSAVSLVYLNQCGVLQHRSLWPPTPHIVSPVCVCVLCSFVCKVWGPRAFLHSVFNTFGLNHLFSETRHVNPVVLIDILAYSEFTISLKIKLYEIRHKIFSSFHQNITGSGSLQHWCGC